MNGRRAALSGLLLAVTLTAVAYRHLPAGYFVHDDWDWLEIAARSRSDPALLLQRHLDPFNYAVFRPIPMTAIALLYRVAGTDAAAYYVTNLVAHLVNVTLVWMLAGSLGLGAAGRIGAAAAFGLNWGHREAVLQIHILQTLLCTGFSLVAGIFWLRFVREGVWRWYGVTALAGLLALLSQEFAAVLPLALIALEYGATGRATRWRPAAALWLPMAPALARILLGRSGDPMLAGAVYGVGPHLLTNLFAGLTGLLFPPLSHTEAAPPLAARLPLGLGREPLVALAQGLTVAAAAALWWRGPRLSRGLIGWAVLALAPILPFIYPPTSRYLYLPFAGVALLFGLAADRGTGSGRPLRRAAMAVFGVVWTSFHFAALRYSTDRMVARGEHILDIIRTVHEAVPSPPPGSVIYLLHTPTATFNLSKLRASRMFRFVYGTGVHVEERAPETWAAVPPPRRNIYVVRLSGSGAPPTRCDAQPP